MSSRTCSVCHQRFDNYMGFKSHVSSEYRRFEKTFGRRAKDWTEIVEAFNGKPPVTNLLDFEAE